MKKKIIKIIDSIPLLKKIKQFIYRIYLFIKYTIDFGLENAFSMNILMNSVNKKSKKIIKINIPHIKTPVYIRKGTTDILVFNQIFIKKPYKFTQSFKAPFIIDLGANVGYTILNFLKNYPDAEIVAVEPDEGNFDILKMNLKSYKSVQLFKTAIWSRITFLKVFDIKGEEWGIQVKKCKKSDPAAFKAIDIKTILKKFKKEKIDILKIDVEGTEGVLFRENYKSWLNKTNVLIIELHDKYFKGCRTIFDKAISQFPFKIIKDHKEHVILIRDPLL